VRVEELAILVCHELSADQRKLMLERLRKGGASLSVLVRAAGLEPKRREALYRLLKTGRLEQLLVELKGERLRLLRPGDEDYPPLLRHLPDPPEALFARGEPGLARREGVAVVGTRSADRRGRKLARIFACGLASAGLLVVSGAASGIDGEAHRGAGVERTCAVLGTGFDHPYPAANAGLIARIGERGLLLSEHPPWAEPRPWHFPRRNRIVSGLCRAVLVIQAPERSGACITARLALDQGREVFACPGPAGDPLHEGCHRLIREGARLVAGPRQMLEDLSSLPLGALADLPPMKREAPAKTDAETAPPVQPTEPQRRLLSRLDVPRSRDQLVLELGLSSGELAGLLVDLELGGLVNRLPGDRWERCNWLEPFIR